MAKPRYKKDDRVRFSNVSGEARNQKYDGLVATVEKVHRGGRRGQNRYDIVFENGLKIEAMEDDLKPSP